MANDVNITSETVREYIDNASVKKYSTDVVIPKYFEEDLDLTYSNVGLQGFVTEQIAQIAEDTFNTASVLMREAFPIRAQIPESIYSHAAIFQMSNAFGAAGYGNFYLTIDQNNLIDNLVTIDGTNYFFIDKDTTVLVDGIPFVLDYDVEIKGIRREYITQTRRSTAESEKYIFTARYMMEEYDNSISTLTNPYIRVREYSGDYNILILNLLMRQCQRTVIYESITTNASVNYPVINVPFTGTLAGFDVLYRKPTETEFKTQLEKRVAYSLPVKTPFCYYKLLNENTLQIYFTSRDTYFQPEFNAELKIIVYTTLGSKGNFESYTGQDLVVRTTTENYSNNVSFAVSARPISGVYGGQDQMTLDQLQAFTVEGFSTANALTTEPDLDIYFSNYGYRYNGTITWVKKRDDVRERLYGAYLLMKKEDYIFPTNTLHLECNINQFKKTADGRYVLEPGHLFVYKDGSTDTAVFYKDPDKEASFTTEYEDYIANNPYWYPEEEQENLPEALQGPMPYNVWLQEVKGEEDTYTVTSEAVTSVVGTSSNPIEQAHPFVYTNPFLIVFTKNPTIIGMYLTQVSQTSDVDFIWQNDNAFVQWNIATVSVSRVLEEKKRYHVTVQTTANIDSLGEFEEAVVTGTGFNSRDALAGNSLRVFITMLDNGREVMYTELVPTAKNSDGIYIFETDLYTDDHITSNSRIRILDTVDGVNMDANVVGSSGILDDVLVPIDNVELRVYTLYNKHFTTGAGAVQDPFFKQFDETLTGYYPTNIYSTKTEPITLVKPMNAVRCHLAFEDYINEDYEVGDCVIRSVPLVKYDLLTDMKSDDWEYFLANFIAHYEHMNDIITNKLRNTSHIDLKFYNSYGKSNNYMIGEEDQAVLINTVNPTIYFDIWLTVTADPIATERDLKVAIKDYIESVNKASGTNLYISNLIHYIEDNFPAVDHLRFCGIENYDTDYQAITNITKDIDTMTREERRYYVPEVLNTSLDQIILTLYSI